ncbi:DUF2142 domain-containing protein [Cellulomonas sp. ES6]|uniref:ArnT family glycosyltransferase n=1 Tax=Cellulomonas sp. ES6 TaxID=3039384 RepID=UPI0024B6899C|nr:DUF2142 domain-containing protein [Cellulomonas sp. ES6]WHP18343.1 DUF2142 domain-containing protein [Cellulomonas sp. ES6]
MTVLEQTGQHPDASSAPRPGVRALARSLPRTVGLVTAVWVAVLLAWTVVLPAFRSADEASHIGAAMSWEHTHEWPGFKKLYAWRQINPALGPAQWRGYPQLDGATASLRDERPSFDELGPAQSSSWINNLGQHPPGYYMVIGVATGVLPDSTPYDLEAWVLRLLNVLMMAPLPFVLALAARALTDQRAVVLTASLMPLAIPQLAALGAAVNNDNLLTIACAVVTLGAVLVARGDLRARTGVWTGLALAVGLLTKAWALLFVPVVVLAYVVALVRTRDLRRSLTGLVAAGAAAGLGGWWWIASLLRYGTLQPAGHVDHLPVPLEAADAWRTYVHDATVLVVSRFWAALSIRTPPDVPAADPSAQPYPLWLTGGLSVLALLLAAVVLVRRRTFGAGRADGLLLVTPFVLNVAVLVESTWGLYLATGVPRGLQGRYLFTSVAGLAVAAALGLGVLVRGRARRWLPLAVGAGALAFTASAMLKALEFHWAGDSLLDRIASLGAWSPLVAPVTGAILVAVPVCSIALLVALARPGRTDTGDVVSGGPRHAA